MYFSLYIYENEYIYISSDTEKSENSWPLPNITKQVHMTHLLPSVLQNVNKCGLYFCKRKYCENINIVSIRRGKGIPPGTGRAQLRSRLMMLNFLLQLWENRFRRLRVRQRTDRIIQTDSQTDSIVCQLVWSSPWTELTQKNESSREIVMSNSRTNRSI